MMQDKKQETVMSDDIVKSRSEMSSPPQKKNVQNALENFSNRSVPSLKTSNMQITDGQHQMTEKNENNTNQNNMSATEISLSKQAAQKGSTTQINALKSEPKKDDGQTAQ